MKLQFIIGVVIGLACIQNISASVPCQNGDIRLVGGTTIYEGRMEVCWNETWGTVCDDYWSSADAIVACRQLGFPTTGAKALSHAPFGQGTGSIYLDNLICTGSETRLVNCRHNGIAKHNCLHSEDAGLLCPCRNGDIRLVGGTTAYEGRVEICWNRIWGTVCHDFWSLFDATVACRQLGFPTTSVKVYKNAHFGQGIGPIHLDNLICNSTETKLVDCRHNGIGVHNCIHSEDAGLRCQMPCTNGDIRLQGGTNRYEGRVEICNNNAWGTVCDDSWSTSDARVACTQLGFSAIDAVARSRAYFGRGTGAILLDQVACTGNETRLVNCRSNPLGIHDCSHSEDAGVTCQPPCTNGDIRLQGGTNQYEGRVEICNNNAWGTVCDDFWSTSDARVVCRQLGFSSIGAIARSRAYFGRGTGAILLDDVACTGNETRLVNCRNNPLGIHNCGHHEDAGVTCRAFNPCARYNGGCSHLCLLSNISGGYTCACPDGHGYRLAANQRDCIVPCQNGDIRLVGGTTIYEGRMEVCWNETWGTVCDDYWSSADAIVACRQLGFPTTGAKALSRAPFGKGTGPIYLDNLICISNETRLVNCQHNGIAKHNCLHSEDAGLLCPCRNGDIRLVGGTTAYEGRVEICWNRIWGTVCHDFWSLFDATVACRQLGFPTTSVKVYKNAHFGQGIGPIHLDNLICNSTETKLVDCRHNGVGVHNCIHSEDAGLRCQMPCTNGDIRLRGSTNHYEGRVEICNNNDWSTVCDDSWSTSDARVVCTQLGFSAIAVIAYSNSYFGWGTGSILLDQVACTGNETRLVDCPSNPLGVHDCSHSEDAGVTCQPPCTNGDIRLRGGMNQYEGRVEICNNNAWGTVCDDSWSTSDARVVCRELEFSPTGAIARSRAYFGHGSGSILLDQVACTGNETRVVNCSSNPLGIHDCSHVEDAGVTCQALCTNGDIRLQGGTNQYEGRVEICNNNDWGTVCDDSWSTSDARVVCTQLEFSPIGAIAQSRAYFGRGTGSILLDQVACTGNETRLVNCSSNPLGLHDCSHSEDAGVTCQPPCTNGDIRLRDGKNKYEGRVEICNNNAWGTVCDDSWSTSDATVVCRQLGFSPIGAIARSPAFFGQGTGIILLDQVKCTGTETRLVDCSSNPLGVHDCSHSKDAGVTCQPPCTNGDIRIQGGSNRYEGRVEICNNNQWGTVCDDSWSTLDAKVACRQLGFSSIGAIARSRAYFGKGTGSILLDQVACTGNETRLVNCRSNPLGVHNCGHHEDAGVTCQGPCTDGDIRLQGGTSTNRFEGRVEICNNNAWGTVCDDSWDTSDAKVVCRQLGFSTRDAVARSRAYFGQGTGAILLDQVACTGNETRLVNCPSNPLGVHNCGHHEDAGVTCRQFLR